jgi:alkanesulfonate monooxygenase SsuD/methylene tetrahydromethanopterin reductase-like flavin-dependent oxidoreductase (luciferase family)
MDVGLSLPVDAPLADLAAHAEREGLDYIASGEHVFFHGPMPSSIVSVSIAAGATSRIKLLTSVVLLPLYPPALLAKMAAALDVGSGGRLTLGVGIGGEYPPEFVACGVDVRTRAGRADEALPLLDRLLRGERVEHRGEYYRIDGDAIQPAPVTRPRPPIWVAGRKPGALRRAALLGDGWLPYLSTPADIARGRAAIAAERGERGPFRTVVTAFVRIEEDGDAARRNAGEYISDLYQQDLRFAAAKWAIAGSPEECRSRIAEYDAAGADGVIAVLCATRDEYFEMTSRVAATLRPVEQGAT